MTRVAAAQVSSSIANAATTVSTAVNWAVLDAFAGGLVGNGLSIYLPGVGDSINSLYNNDLNFVADTKWVDFLSGMIVVHMLDGSTAGVDHPAVDNPNYWEDAPRGSLETSDDAADVNASSPVVINDPEITSFSSASGDWYAFNVKVGDALTIQTYTPSDGPFEFVNSLDPMIELYDPSGTMVVSDDNSAQDGRNSIINHISTLSGTYVVHVLSSGETEGEYVLTVNGYTGSNAAPFVTDTDPDHEQRVPAFPLTYTLEFSESILIDSMEPADLLIGGLPALSVSIVNANTFDFEVDPAANVGDGLYIVGLLAGSISDLQGNNNAADSWTFTLDTTGPRMIETRWNAEPFTADGIIYEASPTVIDIVFDEEIADPCAWLITTSPVSGLLSGAHQPDECTYNPSTSTVTMIFNDPLPEDTIYALTLLSGDGMFEDLVGNNLDGESLGEDPDGTPTGDGIPGGNYIINFTIDRAVGATATDFQRLQPLGSLMSVSENKGLVNWADDQDDYTFFLEGGQTVSAVAIPDGPNAILSLEIPGVVGPIVAAGPGKSVVLPITSIDFNGIVNVHISGDISTLFTLNIYRNAILEAESGGDTYDGNELAIDGSYINLGSGRYGLIGKSNLSEVTSVVWAVQPATGQILKIDPASGTILDAFVAPDALAPGHTQIGLSIAEEGNSLLYVNSDIDPTTLYRLDPDTGAVLSFETITPDIIDGLGFDIVMAPEVIYSANLDADPEWSISGGEWQFGQPTGQGGDLHGNPDPTSGFTGMNVYGVNLYGDYNSVPAGPYYLTTGLIDCSGCQDVTLEFQRWLNTDYQPFVSATIDISLDGETWVEIWNNGGGEIADNAWQSQVFDISTYADNASVYLRWGYEVANGAYSYSGWNIDDIVITGTSPAQYSKIFLGYDDIDIRRQSGFSGPETSDWATGIPTGGLGGDDAGRQFGFFTDGLIHEYDPSIDTDSFISDLPAPAPDIEGMAFDGINLYVSTVSGGLYTLNPDNGSVLNMVTIPGGGLFGLGAIELVSGPIDVAILGAPGGGATWLDDVVTKVQATGLFRTVDSFIVGGSGAVTPTLEQLQAYDSVMVFSDAYFLDSTTLGNNLADFVDGGGGVVVQTFAFNVSPLAGRWDSGGYSPIQIAGQSYGTPLTLGTIFDPGHAIMQGVSAFNGGTSSYHNTGAANPNASVIANWSNERPLVVDLQTFNGGIVGLNFYPPSSDTRSDFWVATTDGALLIANALQYVAGGSGSSMMLPDTDEYTVDLTGKAGHLIDILLAGQNDIDFSDETLELLDTDGVTVLVTATPQPMGMDVENYDLGILDMIVPADVIYTIRLASTTEGDYGILITDSLVFDTEPNNNTTDILRSLNGTQVIGDFEGNMNGWELTWEADTKPDLALALSDLGVTSGNQSLSLTPNNGWTWAVMYTGLVNLNKYHTLSADISWIVSEWDTQSDAWVNFKKWP